MTNHSPATEPLRPESPEESKQPDVKTLAGFARFITLTLKAEMLKCSFCEDPDEGILV